ncbi:MAG: alpha/beta hydrolase [Calditrichaeota bacterium]|nr:MAG: alpha/beta hydrolase [Calditrichota bacterium]
MSQEALQLIMSTEGSPRQLIRKKLTLAFSKDFMKSEEIEHLINQRLLNPQPTEAFRAQLAAGATFNLSDKVKQIKAPCLIAAATEDVLVPVGNAYNLAGKIPNSVLKIYEGLGHQFFVEIPEQFNRDVIAFLKEEMDKE